MLGNAAQRDCSRCEWTSGGKSYKAAKSSLLCTRGSPKRPGKFWASFQVF